MIKSLLYSALLVGGSVQAQQLIQPSENKLFQQVSREEYDVQLLYYTEKAVQGKSVKEVLENSQHVLIQLLEEIPENKIQYSYRMGKWSVGQVLQHLISYERIMTEKALIIAGEITGDYQYQVYTQSSTAAGGRNKTKSQLLEEFLKTRKATIDAFNSFSDEQLLAIGGLDGFKSSVRMISLCISGHQTHHFQVLKEKYKVFGE
ncbi:MAG: DinB family protein [Bacteroidota bacterium]